MKKRPAQQIAEPSATVEGAQIIPPGTYPSKRNTATAEVLTRLLAGETITAATALEFASTMRAPALVHYLTERYGWCILSDPRAAGCADGRVAMIAAYRLPQQTIVQARLSGGNEFAAEVHKARAALRARKAEAFRIAAARNRASARRANPAQGEFFGGEL